MMSTPCCFWPARPYRWADGSLSSRFQTSRQSSSNTSSEFGGGRCLAAHKLIGVTEIRGSSIIELSPFNTNLQERRRARMPSRGLTDLTRISCPRTYRTSPSCSPDLEGRRSSERHTARPMDRRDFQSRSSHGMTTCGSRCASLAAPARNMTLRADRTVRIRAQPMNDEIVLPCSGVWPLTWSSVEVREFMGCHDRKVFTPRG
jgi:hypothetical protein